MSINKVEKIDNFVKVKTALISVSDKTGLDFLIPGLLEVNPKIEIISTGGTYKRIKEILGKNASKNLVTVSAYTGQPETQGGLVKTLDFKIYLGLLTETYNESHQKDLERTGAKKIDMVVCNLYPFEEIIKKEGVTPEMARGNIDIGGPCMIRAAAKNFIRVLSIVNPAFYKGIIENLKFYKGCTDLDFRLTLAKIAFAHTAEYDKSISEYLNNLAFNKV